MNGNQWLTRETGEILQGFKWLVESGFRGWLASALCLLCVQSRFNCSNLCSRKWKFAALSHLDREIRSLTSQQHPAACAVCTWENRRTLTHLYHSRGKSKFKLTVRNKLLNYNKAAPQIRADTKRLEQHTYLFFAVTCGGRSHVEEVGERRRGSGSQVSSLTRADGRDRAKCSALTGSGGPCSPKQLTDWCVHGSRSRRQPRRKRQVERGIIQLQPRSESVKHRGNPPQGGSTSRSTEERGHKLQISNLYKGQSHDSLSFVWSRFFLQPDHSS